MKTSTTWIDRPQEVRSEDALDVAVIREFLKPRLPDLQGELRMQQFRGGASNLTYLLRFDNTEYILRCPPKGTKAKSAHDMGREYRIMRQLKPVYPYVPEMIAFCEDMSLIGREFYVMEKLHGIIPRANLPKDLHLSPEQIRQLCLNVVDKLIELHRIDAEKAGLLAFGKGAGYAQRQIEGWSDRYRKAKTWNVPSARYIMDWLAANLPKNEHTCFIHNDFRFDNVVLDPQNPMQVIGVLDWEMATVGDPLMDLGNSLAYWVQADDDVIHKMLRRQPTHLPGMLTRREVIDYYMEQTGFRAENFTFYEVYGLFRLAAIVQQIYYRYHHRQTRNKAYRHFWILANYLCWRCRRAIANARM